MSDIDQTIGSDVVRGLVSRSLDSSPELKDPPPMTSEEVYQYELYLSKLPMGKLAKERSLIDSTYDLLEPALPEWRKDLGVYPHPIMQRRLLCLNEWYRRAELRPVFTYNYHRTKAMIEWGAAGAAIGGSVSFFAKKNVLLGLGIGSILGAVAGRSELFQNLLMSISSRAIMI